MFAMLKQYKDSFESINLCEFINLHKSPNTDHLILPLYPITGEELRNLPQVCRDNELRVYLAFLQSVLTKHR